MYRERRDSSYKHIQHLPTGEPAYVHIEEVCIIKSRLLYGSDPAVCSQFRISERTESETFNLRSMLRAVVEVRRVYYMSAVTIFPTQSLFDWKSTPHNAGTLIRGLGRHLSGSFRNWKTKVDFFGMKRGLLMALVQMRELGIARTTIS